MWVNAFEQAIRFICMTIKVILPRSMNMKTQVQAILLACSLLWTVNSYSTVPKDQPRYVSIEKLAKSSALKIKLKSKGGFHAYCMSMQIENKGNDTCFALVEAGRRLESVDTTQQDIFIVKNEYAVVPPKAKLDFSLYGFCCISHNKSPKAGSAFTVGSMEGKDWQSVAKLINDHDFEQSAIQSAVWAISNGHPVSSISRGKDDRNLLLLQTVAQIKGIELPWYSTQYIRDEQRVFSNKPKSIQGDINYHVAYEGVVSVLVKDQYGVVQSTLVDNVPRNKGPYTYYLDLDIAAWKDGKYELVIVQDGNKVLETKTFEINRAIIGH